MKISKQTQRQANILFNACKTLGTLDSRRALLAIDLLIEKRPRAWRAILEHLKKRIRLEMACRAVHVQSAVILNEYERENISGVIRKTAPGTPLDFRFSESSELLGGLRVQIGWKVLDASLKARLESILE
jgi:F0F1-type ATP synthase delta subunit